MTGPCVKTTWVEHLVIGAAAVALAAIDPLFLWAAGHWPWHYTVPRWAYVALFLIAADINIGPIGGDA